MTKSKLGAFMKKFIICAVIIALVSSLSLPVFAAEKNGFSYSGSSYWATVKYGVNFRDKSDNIIRYLSASTNVHVLGVSNKDASRVVIEYGNTVGTVLTAGLKWIPAPVAESGLTYSGTAYYGKVKNYLNVRDANDKVIGTITQNEVVRVLGTYNKNATRVVIEYGNTKGTVLKAGLIAVFSGGNVSQSSTSYYAVTVNGLNMRDSNGNLICYIPRNSLICVKGTYAKDSSRVTVQFYGIEGNVLKDGVKKVKDAVFVSIYRQKVTVIKNGKFIAESDCVTGLENVRNTRRGAFKVAYMQRNRTLNGTNYRGEKYAQPVEFWVRFYGSTGFHSASYRSSFGGAIYKTNGSNGCVNLPYKFAKTLYTNAYIGMPVYVA